MSSSTKTIADKEGASPRSWGQTRDTRPQGGPQAGRAGCLEIQDRAKALLCQASWPLCSFFPEALGDLEQPGLKTPQSLQGPAAQHRPKLQAHGSDGQSSLPALTPVQGDHPSPCAPKTGLSVLT